MNKVIFHEKLHKGLWEKIIEHAMAAYRMGLAKDSYGEPIYDDIPFDSVFTLLDALTKAQEENLEMSDTAWAVLLSDGDVERARTNPCKGLGWRVKRIYDELQELSHSLETIEGVRAYQTPMERYHIDKVQIPLTFKKLQDIIKFYRDDAKVFFDNLKIFIDIKKVWSQAWRQNWSVQLGLLFNIEDFQYMVNPPFQIIEIEFFKRRYLIGRQIIDFNSSDILDYKRTHVPDNYRVEMRLWLRNYWIEKVKQKIQVVEHSEDEDMITCERCGRCWDGRAQCPCGLGTSDDDTDDGDTDDDDTDDDTDDTDDDEEEQISDDDTDDDEEEQISEEVKRVKDSIKKVQTIIDAELNGNISDGIYIDLMNQLKLAFDSCH